MFEDDFLEEKTDGSTKLCKYHAIS